MASYFAYRSMSPFGNSSILTVDLGQQYIDFFAYFRSTVLHHFNTFFYSFSKDLGGDMLGVFSYYLMSPLNLLILFFPGKNLSAGVLILLILKYGLSGLSFAWLLDKTHLQSGIRLIGFATAYALMGWMIANQLNVIWLDVLILLPLVIYGLIKLLNGGRATTYVIWLTILLIDNYYMAWMVAIFSILFTLYYQSGHSLSASEKGHRFASYVGHSLLAVLLAAWLLLPTLYSLSQSKGTYTETKWHFKFEYFAPKMLAKLFSGSFNFDQMPNGQPNIFVGALMIFGFLLYFTNRKFSRKNRIITAIISAFFVLSMCFQPLDLLWHAGQFPVWYPYRFSFLVCFWMIWLAANTLTAGFRINRLQISGLLIILLIVSLYLYLNLKSFSYLSSSQLLFGIGISLIAIVWLHLPRKYTPLIYDILFVLLVVADSGINAVVSLNNISYVSQADFGNYTTQLNKTISKLPSMKQNFYRVGQTFMRTKDDPMQGDFYSASHFGSTLEPSIPAFMGSIGQPDGDGFVTYTNGTQVSDSLLSMQYFMTTATPTSIVAQQMVAKTLPIVSNKPDVNRFKQISGDALTKTYHNSNALPIAFGASNLLAKQKLTTKDPLAYQAQIYQSLAGIKTNQNKLFQVQNFDNVSFENIQQSSKITGIILKKKDLLKPAAIKMTFTPKTNNSYYLTMGSELDEDAGTYYLNGKELNQYPTYRNTIVVNVASQQKDEPITITFKLKHQTLWLQNVSLYMLNQTKFNQMHSQLANEPLKVKSSSSTKITGNINIKKSHQLLMTTIPYSQGWQVQIDGKKVATQKVAKTFLAVPISKGHHRVVIKYRSPFFILGTIISGVTLVASLSWFGIKRRSK